MKGKARWCYVVNTSFKRVLWISTWWRQPTRCSLLMGANSSCQSFSFGKNPLKYFLFLWRLVKSFSFPQQKNFLKSISSASLIIYLLSLRWYFECRFKVFCTWEYKCFHRKCCSLSREISFRSKVRENVTRTKQEKNILLTSLRLFSYLSAFVHFSGIYRQKWDDKTIETARYQLANKKLFSCYTVECLCLLIFQKTRRRKVNRGSFKVSLRK